MAGGQWGGGGGGGEWAVGGAQAGQPFTTRAGIRLLLTGGAWERHEKLRGSTDSVLVWSETEGNWSHADAWRETWPGKKTGHVPLQRHNAAIGP